MSGVIRSIVVNLSPRAALNPFNTISSQMNTAQATISTIMAQQPVYPNLPGLTSVSTAIKTMQPALVKRPNQGVTGNERVRYITKRKARFVTSQITFNTNKIGVLNNGTGSLTGTNMARKSLKFQLLQSQPRLAAAVPSMSSQAPSPLTKLFP